MTITVLMGLVYVVAQQQYRAQANDPQIQVARDAVAMANAGQAVESLIPTERVNIAESLAPFIGVYNQDSQPILGSGLLNDRMPTPPAGVFTYAKQHGENRLTWQPAPGVRIAAVVLPYTGAQSGFILVGRNLREAEQRINDMGDLVMLAWPVTLVTTLLACLYLAWLKERLG